MGLKALPETSPNNVGRFAVTLGARPTGGLDSRRLLKLRCWTYDSVSISVVSMFITTADTAPCKSPLVNSSRLSIISKMSFSNLLIIKTVFLSSKFIFFIYIHLISFNVLSSNKYSLLQYIKVILPNNQQNLHRLITTFFIIHKSPIHHRYYRPEHEL